MTEDNEDSDIEELVEANRAFNEENAKLKRELNAAKAREQRAKNKIVELKNRHEAEDGQIGQDGTARFEDGELVKPETRTLDEPSMRAKLEELKFMNEPVTVYISDVAEDNADAMFSIEINGHQEWFKRGHEKTVKRCFVEGLARAKKTAYRNVSTTNPDTGEKEYQYPSKTGLRFPFSVVQDPNPRGKAWLTAVLRQP